MNKLTEQELKIARMAAEGYMNKEIAHDLRLAEKTVKNYMNAIFKKLECKNRMGLAVLDAAGEL